MTMQGWDPGLRKKNWNREGIQTEIWNRGRLQSITVRIRKERSDLGVGIGRDTRRLLWCGVIREFKARLYNQRNQGMDFVLLKTKSYLADREIRIDLSRLLYWSERKLVMVDGGSFRKF